MKKPKLPQFYKVLCKWYTAMDFEGKLITGPVITEKAKLFSSLKKIADKCTFPEGSNK